MTELAPSNAALLVAGMFLVMIWRRIDGFLVEVRLELFEPTPSMVRPFVLYMNQYSENCFLAATTIFWIMVGINAAIGLVEMRLFFIACKEGRVANLDAKLMDEIESQQERDMAAIGTRKADPLVPTVAPVGSAASAFAALAADDDYKVDI